MTQIEDTLDRGNAVERFTRDGYTSRITCADGFSVSVIAGGGAYSSPRSAIPGPSGEVRSGYGTLNEEPSDYPGPYSAVELGFPSERPEPWDVFAPLCEDPKNPTETVYGFVPAEVIRALIASHGGEA